MANIQAKDLRIGSYYLLSGYPYQLDEKGLKNILVFNHIKSLSPIPLTPVILQDAGFNQFHEFDMADEHWRIRTKHHYFVLVLLHGRYIAQVYFEVDVPYLHQLQNLFYDLTGEELTVNLSTIPQMATVYQEEIKRTRIIATLTPEERRINREL